MHIAYLISAHTDAPQLKRLIDALHPDAHYFIHIDQKSVIDQFTSIISGENIHFIADRKDVRWGTIIEVEYQMALIKAALDHPQHFDRILFLSGMDYPLWSNDHITEWLQAQGKKEILQGIDMTTGAITEQQQELYTIPRPFFKVPAVGNKLNQRFSILSRKVCEKVGKRKRLFLYNGWHLYKGSAWWCISQELAQYIYDTWTGDEKLRHYFLDSFGQAETVIQTIAMNSDEWRSRCIITRGEYPGLAALTPLHYINYDPVIKIMNEDDYATLQQSGKMFARKFISGESDRLVQLLNDRK